MPNLSNEEMLRRAIVIRDRLNETKFLRGMNLKPDTVEVGLAIALGYYTRRAVNVAAVVEETLMNKATVTRHAEKLANLPEPLITINRRGQETILRLTEAGPFHSAAIAYFNYRYRALVENGAELQRLLTG